MNGPKRVIVVTFGLLLCGLGPHRALAQDLMDLLAKGPVVSVNERGGRFENVLAVVHVQAPIETSWEVATDFLHYPDFMPKLERAEVKVVDPAKPHVLDVTFEVEVPGMNPAYTYRYELSRERWQIAARWQAGDLKGSYCRWVLVPYREHETLIYYTSASKNFNKMAQALEDKQQTLTIGVNVSSAVAVVKGAKVEAEARWALQKKKEAPSP